MARPRNINPPKYCRHKPSGQGCVYINRTPTYLGPYGTRESREAYDALVSRWLLDGAAFPRC